MSGKNAIAGVISTAISTCVLYPIENIKTRV